MSHNLSDSREFSNYNYQPEFFLSWLIEKLDNQMGNERFTLLENIFKKIMSTFDEENIWKVLHNRDVAPLISDGNEDYISIGSGYRSPEGQKIPLLVEKSFSFAKSLSWSWQSGSIFNPTVFQHKMDNVSSPIKSANCGEESSLFIWAGDNLLRKFIQIFI